MNWATNHDASLEKLRKVQGRLTVGLIMVPRADFLTCSRNDTALDVKTRNADNYSFLPVVDEVERVIGLYNAEQWFNMEATADLVGSDFLPISEETVIGADASIFDFIRKADDVPTKLVVSGDGVAGLVSLSDIQQLPVRAALFALVTSLEMAMAMAIEARWPTPEDWLALIAEHRQKQLRKNIKSALKKDSFVSEITLTQFSDKSTILLEGGILAVVGDRDGLRLDAIRQLRNSLAHSKPYADTPETAKSVCQVVRSIYELKDALLRHVADLRPLEGAA